MVLLKTDAGLRRCRDEYPLTKRNPRRPKDTVAKTAGGKTAAPQRQLEGGTAPLKPSCAPVGAHLTRHLRGGCNSCMIERFREKFPAPVLPLASKVGPAGGEAPRFRRYLRRRGHGPVRSHQALMGLGQLTEFRSRRGNLCRRSINLCVEGVNRHVGRPRALRSIAVRRSAGCARACTRRRPRSRIRRSEKWRACASATASKLPRIFRA